MSINIKHNTKYLILAVVFGILSSGCEKESPTTTDECPSDNSMSTITTRSFKMGFSTWLFGPNWADWESTYNFIEHNADIYSEQIDNKIPWNAWINNTELPEEFLSDLALRLSKREPSRNLLLSVSLLNIERTNLNTDYDGTLPQHTAMNDTVIENAYFKHMSYLITQFNPTYVVLAMEVNELKLKSEPKWEEYKLLMANIRRRLNEAFPGLPLSESVTLHSLYRAETTNPEAYITEITQYVNQNLDYAAISFYPFLKGLHSKPEYQQAFDFLHNNITKPIAFSETAHLAETLSLAKYNLNISSDVCEQKDYLETLLVNAHQHNYKYIIWWCHRDYDQLWETFPEIYKEDIGKIWRDTGLLDENGLERPSYKVWSDVFTK